MDRVLLNGQNIDLKIFQIFLDSNLQISKIHFYIIKNAVIHIYFFEYNQKIKIRNDFTIRYIYIYIKVSF